MAVTALVPLLLSVILMGFRLAIVSNQALGATQGVGAWKALRVCRPETGAVLHVGELFSGPLSACVWFFFAAPSTLIRVFGGAKGGSRMHTHMASHMAMCSAEPPSIGSELILGLIHSLWFHWISLKARIRIRKTENRKA